MKNGIRLLVGTALLAAMLICSAVLAAGPTPIPELAIGEVAGPVFPESIDGNRATYQGNLRIWMSEPVSRYKDLYNAPYAFGFLNWAGDVGVTINDGEVYTWTTTWDASADGGFTAVTEGNICAQAVLSDPTPHTAYSDPPSGNPFFAYYVDAAAQAIPGQAGQNVAGNGTHTVFVEEGTQKY